MPPVQEQVTPIQPAQPNTTGANGMPMVQQVQVMPDQKKDVASLLKTIALIIVSLVAVAFIGLFIWIYMQYDEVRTDVDGQIALAVAVAKDEQVMKDETEFLEREKYPYKTFAGPVDYGQLSFEYPKTWSVYVDADAANGGDFEAYFNPVQVDSVNSKDTINALRVKIYNESFESVTGRYQRDLDRDLNFTMESVTVNDITMNRYRGTIPGTEFSGIIIIFKIRDKTALLQTDSVVFEADFDKLVETIKFNA